MFDQRSGSQRRLGLLASCSLTALLIGGGAPAWAACTAVTGSVTNNSVISGYCVTNTSFSGYIDNTGTISPSGIKFTNGTFTGQITSTGTIIGGISLDSPSKIDPGSANAIFINGQTFTGGISSAGTISAAFGYDGIFSGNLVTSFSGGVSNSGIISAGVGFGMAISASTFSGGISNSGMISVGDAGIYINNMTTFSGGITNSGTIAAALQGGIVVELISTFSGNISNAGTISSGGTAAIEIIASSTIHGSIIDSGTILATSRGILIDSTSRIIASATAIAITGPTFTGGISSAGTVSGGDDGINVGGNFSITNANRTITVSSFAGGVRNAGTISAGRTGIAIGGFASAGSTANATIEISTFAGGITNSGTIRAGFGGIVVGGQAYSDSSASSGHTLISVGTFSGGISNSGLISVGKNGIVVGGTAVNELGIASVSVSNFSGGITNSGTISAADVGIVVGGIVAPLRANGTVTVSTFSGGITNSGEIHAATGIVVNGSVSTFLGAIANSGTITGTGGTAIDVRGANNAMTIDQTGGLISGAIKLSAHADVLNISGGAINGDIVGQGSANTINFAPGAGNTFTYGSAYGFSGINQVNVNSGTAILDGSNSATNVTVNGGTLQLGNGGTSGALAGNIVDNGTFAIDRSDTYTFAGTIFGSGAFVQMGSGTTVLSGSNNYSGGTTIGAGALQAANSNSVGTGTVTLDGGGFRAGAAGLAFGNGFAINATGGTIDTQAYTLTLAGVIGNGNGTSGVLTKIGSGTLILSGSNSYSGATNVDAGTLQAGAANAFSSESTFNVAPGATLALNGFNQTIGTLSGNGNVTLGSATLTAGGNNADATFSGTISGTGGLDKAGSGTLTLTGTSNYTGITDISGGTLEVDGDIASSSSVNVNTGGTLAGTGTVDPNTIAINSGGSLAPGISGVAGGVLTIAGNLTMASGSFYDIVISPTQASKTQVTGTATLNSPTIIANLTGSLGSYASTTYTILSATTVIGSFNPNVTIVGSGLTSAEKLVVNGAALSLIDTTGLSVLLPTYAITLALPSNAPYNAQNAGDAINHFILAGGTLPAGFQNLAALSGPALSNAVNQLAGQPGGAFVPTGFMAGDMFLNMVLDPFVDGRGTGFGPGMTTAAANESPALAYADDPVAARANAAFQAVMPYGRAPAPQLTLWGGSYGGVGTITGNAATGAAGTQSQIYGIIAGLDDHIAADTMIGFALGGGGTNWQLNQALGDGHSGMAQASLYGSQRFGPAYVSGALAYSWQGVTTSRLVTLAGADTLNADFGANVLSSRLETGYRLTPAGFPASGLPVNFGITPYAAAQAQAMFLPAYSEYASQGTNQFASAYQARDYSTVRTELGVWFDTDLPFTTTGALKFYSRVAWAHDFNNESMAISYFQQLPGASFLINTVKPAANTALVTAGLEYKLADGWSLLGKFDGEYSSTTSIYSGTGIIRKIW